MPQSSEKYTLPPVTQIGVVVKDLERAAKYYETTFGLGPFRIFEFAVNEMKVRGKPVSLERMRIGFARTGQLQFELIELPEEETIYHEFYRAKGEGLHHLGIHVADMEPHLAEMRSKGIGILQEGKIEDTSFAYLDTEEVGGVILEFIQRPERR